MTPKLTLRKPGTELTITVTVTREYKIRRWIGMRTIRFGAWILGCGFRCVVEDDVPVQ